MKNNSKWMTTAAVLALSSTLAFAGPGREGKGHHRGGKGGELGARFAQKLSLTDAQKAQIRTLQQNFREQNQPYFEAAKATRQEFRAAKQANDTARVEELKATMQTQRAQMKERHEALRAQVLNVLTPEQRAQYDALKAERGQRRGKRQ